MLISIHAPLRERLTSRLEELGLKQFQSTLPCGSDSIEVMYIRQPLTFQSTLPCGSDSSVMLDVFFVFISIHAPLRERRPEFLGSHSSMIFQSTLPCGSDFAVPFLLAYLEYFNPRSLAGATASKENTSLFI